MIRHLNKKDFWFIVNKSVMKAINKRHVFPVLGILLEEMFKDLMDGKNIYIANFGTFERGQTKPRKHMNFHTKEIEMSTGRNFLKFKPVLKLKKFMIANLDVKATFNEP